MKKVDMRFNPDIFRRFLGKEFVKYRCDEFTFTPSVTQIVGIYIGDDVYKMTNIIESVDYFGVLEDIAVCRFESCETSEVKSAFVDGHLLDTPVNGTISKVVLVNDHQTVVLNGNIKYDVLLTRGVIFTVDGREISFEKDIVPFSEELNIYRGYDLINNFANVTEFTDGWDKNTQAHVEREIMVIE